MLVEIPDFLGQPVRSVLVESRFWSANSAVAVVTVAVAVAAAAAIVVAVAVDVDIRPALVLCPKVFQDD